jgi:hypothetical protein
METVIFKYDLRNAGLPVEDIYGVEEEAVLVDQDELDWYVLEVLEPSQVKAFIELLNKSWYPVGSVSRTNYDSYGDQVSSYRYGNHTKWKPDRNFAIHNPSHYYDYAN